MRPFTQPRTPAMRCAPVTVGGDAAYWVSPRLLPLPARVVAIVGVLALIRVTWFPEKWCSEREVGLDRLSPWLPQDTKAWQEARARALVARASRGEW